MVTRAVVLTELLQPGQGLAWVAQWSGLLNGDDGAPIELDQYGDISAQVTGTFGTGGSVAIEGSNDTTNFVGLKDPSNTLIAFTAAGIKSVLEKTRQVKPHCTAGDGTTTLVVTMYLRRRS
jgi:hypothetical protein